MKGEDKMNGIIEIVGKKLINRGLSISAAESCTAGMFASNLASVAGISACLKESYITYSNEAKIKVLGVKKETIDKFTEVSEETALEMAQGLYTITGSDICVSVTGYAGPGGGTALNPVGTVYIGLKYMNNIKVKKLFLPGLGREEVRTKAMLEMFDFINKNL